MYEEWLYQKAQKLFSKKVRAYSKGYVRQIIPDYKKNITWLEQNATSLIE